NTISPAGRCSNGSAASRAASRARPKVRPSSRRTSSRRRRAPSTTSPTPAPTRRPTGACSASPSRAANTMTASPSFRRIRLGMVGGGPGAFIGTVHRMAARLDDRYELVAGALASDPARARAGGAALGIAADRAYGSYQEMVAKEAARPDRIEAVAIVTPNH